MLNLGICLLLFWLILDWWKRLTKKKHVPNWWNSWITPEIYIFSLCGQITYVCQLTIHELAVAHSKASISWHFVIVFAHTLVVKAPHQKELSAKLVERLHYSRTLHFSFADIWLILAEFIYSWTTSCTFVATICWHFVVFLADTLVVQAPHQKETSAKLVPPWIGWFTPEVYISHLRMYGLYLPNLFIHELAVAHSKPSISWHFVIFLADTLVVKAPH